MSAHRRIERTRRGARIVEGDAVLSEVLRRPGAANRFVDVIAAAVATFAPGPRFLMLGFAAGGVVGPLRAAGWDHPIRSVDLSCDGEELFRELCDAWAGEVQLDVGEAGSWLRTKRRRWDVVLDDLSMPVGSTVTKPPICYGELPARIAGRLRPGGVAIFNLLPVGGSTWDRLERAVSAHWPGALVVSTTDYENRLVVTGEALPGAREAGRRLRAKLRRQGSKMRHQVRMRTLRASSTGQRSRR